MDLVKKYWPIVVFLFALSAAWGETRWQVADNAKEIESSSTLKEEQARIDERTKIIREEQKEQRTEQKAQRKLLEEILRSVK